MPDELDEIKSTVGETIEEPPAPSAPAGEGMKPSIISKKEEAPPAPEAPAAAPAPEVPTPPAAPPATVTPAIPARANIETIEEIAESIINEKWEELMASVGNLAIWKEKVQGDIRAVKQELLRVEERFENLQKAVLGRVEEYHKAITTVSTDVKALEKVLQRILDPLTKNIKELSKITEKLKEEKE